MAKRTEQALKVSASWTPDEETAEHIMAGVFGERTPLTLRGGRLTINAAVACDFAVAGQAASAEKRVQELRKELEARGKLHGFSVAAGAVPVGEAEPAIT